MGDKSKYGPEIREIARELYVNKAYSADEVAKYLFDHHGVVSETNPEKPMWRGTIIKWVAKAGGSVNTSRLKRHRLELDVADHDLDVARKLVYLLIGSGDYEKYLKLSVPEQKMIFECFMEMRKERSRTYGTYPDRRKQVTVTAEVSGVPSKKLDNKTEYNLARFMAWTKYGDGFDALPEHEQEKLISAMQRGNDSQFISSPNGSPAEDVS